MIEASPESNSASTRLYHYACAKNALSNLCKKRLKVAEFHDLNDPFELLGVDLGDDGNRRAFEKWKDEMEGKTGIICLSERCKDILMWSHYADRHRGMCLGFDVPAAQFRPVVYPEEKMPFPGKDGLNEEFMDRLLRTKASPWSYEKEWRAGVQLNDNEWIAEAKRDMFFLPFGCDLVLREVILGMECDSKMRSKVLQHLKSHDPQPVLKSARMAPKTFELRLYT